MNFGLKVIVYSVPWDSLREYKREIRSGAGAIALIHKVRKTKYVHAKTSVSNQ